MIWLCHKCGWLVDWEKVLPSACEACRATGRDREISHAPYRQTTPALPRLHYQARDYEGKLIDTL